MKSYIILISKCLLPAVCLIMGNTANAQKLPNIQITSVRVPANIKIDGKLTEWDNVFQAYNHATETFYSITNDDENLYLVIKATSPDVINRIVGSGITLAIQKSKKDTKNIISITYPVVEHKNGLFFNLLGKKGGVENKSAETADSLMNMHNKILQNNCKWIGTSGITGVDELVSVYNNDGIKAMGLFDNKKAYICEMSLSLKHLRLSINDAAKFDYHILIHGSSVGNITFTPMDNNMTPEIQKAQASMEASANEFSARLSATTDFWGEYTLAK